MWTKVIISLSILPFFNALVPSPPRIIKQPPTEPQLFQTGTTKPFILECEAYGEPIPKYKWFKNGNLFEINENRTAQQPGRGTLVMTNMAESDSGQYQCIAENELGSAISNSVFLVKKESYSFGNIEPIRVTIHEGEPLKLTCKKPKGWPKLKMFWIFLNSDGSFRGIDNPRISVDYDGSLWFSHVLMEDVNNSSILICAAYETIVSYKIGTKFFIDVLPSDLPRQSAPKLQYASNRTITAVKGKTAELFCIYGGAPNPETVWRKGGQPIELSDRLSLANNGKSVVIQNVEFMDQGSYKCEVSNGVGDSLSYTINLQVFAIPYFVEEPDYINASDDEDVEFRCSANGVPKPKINWIYNGKPIEDSYFNPRRVIRSNSIFIQKVSKEDIGNYGCNASNELGYVYKDVYLNVLALPPEFRSVSKTTVTVYGASVRLPCEVFGSPKPIMKYIHKDKVLTGSKYVLLESGDIRINNVNIEDNGDYICIAENKFGKAILTTTLAVEERTNIADKPQDRDVTEGSSAVFHCNPICDDDVKLLEVMWFHNDVKIDTTAGSGLVQLENNSLIITNVTKSDSGKYTCVVITNLDRVSASAKLLVKGTL